MFVDAGGLLALLSGAGPRTHDPQRNAIAAFQRPFISCGIALHVVVGPGHRQLCRREVRVGCDLFLSIGVLVTVTDQLA